MEESQVIGPLLIIIGFMFVFTGFLLIVFAGLQKNWHRDYYKQDVNSRYQQEYHEKQWSGSESNMEQKNNRENKSDLRGGGIIMIGPIPIIFGSDYQSAKILIMLAIILMIIALFIFMV